MWLWWWACAALAAGALAGAAGAGAAADFEFADGEPEEEWSVPSVSGRRSSAARYIYDPENELCRTLVCKKRESCVLSEARPRTALCVGEEEDGASPPGDADAEADAEPGPEAEPDAPAERPAGCVGCGARVRAQFLCGSDNRTYSSLCRLDLHNCVRRPARPVALACRGFCPCPPAPRARPRGRPRRKDYPKGSRRRRPDSARNEVLPPERPRRRPVAADDSGPRPVEECSLERLADRLLDWFSVLMREAGGTAPPPRGFPPGCKPEVRWTFAHLDADGDGELSPENLYSLRHDEGERCLRPFLAACGSARGGGVSRAAWCGCMRRAARPCSALARAHPRRPGAYVPACDARGFYLPRQCHPALGVCWCVDAHGAERPGSRTKGAARCPRRPAPARPAAPAAAPARAAPADDDEDAAPDGSGDAEPPSRY